MFVSAPVLWKNLIFVWRDESENVYRTFVEDSPSPTINFQEYYEAYEDKEPIISKSDDKDTYILYAVQNPQFKSPYYGFNIDSIESVNDDLDLKIYLASALRLPVTYVRAELVVSYTQDPPITFIKFYVYTGQSNVDHCAIQSAIDNYENKNKKPKVTALEIVDDTIKIDASNFKCQTVFGEVDVDFNYCIRIFDNLSTNLLKDDVCYFTATAQINYDSESIPASAFLYNPNLFHSIINPFDVICSDLYSSSHFMMYDIRIQKFLLYFDADEKLHAGIELISTSNISGRTEFVHGYSSNAIIMESHVSCGSHLQNLTTEAEHADDYTAAINDRFGLYRVPVEIHFDEYTQGNSIAPYYEHYSIGNSWGSIKSIKYNHLIEFATSENRKYCWSKNVIPLKEFQIKRGKLFNTGTKIYVPKRVIFGSKDARCARDSIYNTLKFISVPSSALSDILETDFEAELGSTHVIIPIADCLLTRLFVLLRHTGNRSIIEEISDYCQYINFIAIDKKEYTHYNGENKQSHNERISNKGGNLYIWKHLWW